MSSPTELRPRIQAALVALCISVYFFYLAGPSLRADFTYDDLGNLYFAWLRPLPELLRANVLYFLPPTRPLGRLFYALGSRFAGLDPVPYHVVCLIFLFANSFLMYCFTLKLTGSRAVAALACLLHSYHGSAAGLAYNTGTCFDTFCFFFYLGTFTYYISIRQRGRSPRLWQIALLACLYIAALNAKEMAVTLPIMIGLYELLYHPAERWRSRAATIGIMVVITVAYVLGTTRGAESLMIFQEYKPVFSAASYLLQTRSFLNDLIYSVEWFNNSRSVALLSALFAISWLSRNRDLKFCWLFLTVGILPIAFIPPRGLYAAYIPAVGLSVFLAILIVKATSRIENQHIRVGLFVMAALILAVIHKNKGADNVHWITASEHQIRDVIEQLSRLHPAVPTGSRILFLRDPFEGRVWDSIFLLCLLYRDNSLVIERGADGHDPQKYDFVWDFDQGKLLELRGTATGP